MKKETKTNATNVANNESVKTNAKQKKSVNYDFACDYSLLKFNASEKCKKELSTIYSYLSVKHDVACVTLASIDALQKIVDDLQKKEKLSQNEIALLEQTIQKMTELSLKNIYVQKQQNKLFNAYACKLNDLYTCYKSHFNDNQALKDGLKEWAKVELNQDLHETVVTWIVSLLGVKTNAVTKFHKSLLKFMSKTEFTKIVVYAMVELALNKKQLSMDRIDVVCERMNKIYQEFTNDIVVLFVPQKATKKWYIETLTTLALTNETKQALNKMTKDELDETLVKACKQRQQIMITRD